MTKRSNKAGNDTIVVVKVEGTPREKSHPSRTDRWNESFEISVDKANEVEIAVYDKQVGEQLIPIGLLWIRISDLVEALRRQKVEQETGQGGWVTAAGAMQGPAMNNYNGMAPNLSDGNVALPYGATQPAMTAGPASAPNAAQEGIEAWFAVEPAGAIALRLNFGQYSFQFLPKP